MTLATDRPVEFWSTEAIGAALRRGDLGIWKQIVAALQRDPFGRTARQVEAVLREGSDSDLYGISTALSEVLDRARAHLEADECAEVGRHLQMLIERSGLSRHEFASRIGVPDEDLADYLDGTISPPASLMIRMRRLSDRFVKMKSQRTARDN
ncbi:MAG TPA: XRE family transcriptional regulator [Mycobacterium sp.]|nr:XRE family transcriptional regulator [Mycobacterium sp.]